MANMADTKTIERIRTRRFEGTAKLLEKTRAIRRKISVSSGQWDAVKVLRDVRYAK